jgi:acyl dehydratase
MNAPGKRLYWEDFTAGDAADFGEAIVSVKDIIAFALEFDPDPAHLGKAPDDTDFTASDWHSCALLMRMMCNDYLKNAAGIGAPGVEHVRWFGSVRPGDVLHARRTPIETRVSKSRPEVGIVRMYQEVFNQDGEIVLTWLPIQLYERRDPAAEPPPSASSPGPESMKRAMRKPPTVLTDDLRKPVGVFEDSEIGATFDLGSHVFFKDEMLNYARRFNPQYFHADEDAARASLYGGLIASGWHTGAVWNRHLVTHRQNLADDTRAGFDRRPATILSIAVVDMKWSGPVRPGDALAFRTTVTGTSELPEFPQWGLVESFDEGINQRGETVFCLTHRYWIERARPLTASGANRAM